MKQKLRIVVLGQVGCVGTLKIKDFWITKVRVFLEIKLPMFLTDILTLYKHMFKIPTKKIK